MFSRPHSWKGAIIQAAITLLLGDNARENIRVTRKRLWDLWHGVNTTDQAEVDTLNVVGSNRAHASRYESSTAVGKLLTDLQLNFSQYGFVDFGSGKGRVLLEASAFPFRFVKGVEFSTELHQIAVDNLKRYRRARVRCAAVESILSDATEFELPEGPLVLYFFNPFSGPVLASVVANIQRSAKAHPRDIVIVFAGKWMSRELAENIPNVTVLWNREFSAVYRLPLEQAAESVKEQVTA